ncbi:MAG: GTPase family protein [Methylococcaceae bacterium]
MTAINRLKWGWILVFILWITPILVLAAVGGYWVYHHADFRDWLVIGPVSMLIGLAIALRLRKRYDAQFGLASTLSEDALDSPLDRQARNAVNLLAVNQLAVPDSALGFEYLEEWLALGRKTIAVVAALYKPDSKNPELEIPSTWVLLITERVTHDLRELLQNNIPFSDMLTLNDGLTLYKWKDRLQDAAFLVPLTRFLLNPSAGLAAFASGSAQTGITNTILPQIKRSLINSFILKVGHYAILLYSGRLVADSRVTDVRLSESSQRDLATIQATADQLSAEPLRLLVAGQVNAGKSTLINRLNGQLRAPDDVVPCTRLVTSYRLNAGVSSLGADVDGILIDTPGYGVVAEWLDESAELLGTVDLLFLVCSVREAARQADKRFLETLSGYYANKLNRRLPPIIVVATHIDQLRPIREWIPPYNIVEPQTPKAMGIRDALNSMSEDLSLEEYGADIVPVCLADGYNIEVLWLAVANRLNDAHKAKVLRMQELRIEKGKYQQLVRQFIRGGRWLLNGK